MNQNNQSPIDPMREPDPHEKPERLAEIEGLLKKARPHPVDLDADELLRLAGVASQAHRSTPSSPRRRRYRSAALLTGSWLCGAIVGGIVVFLAVRHDAPTVGPPSQTAGGTQKSPVSLVQDKTNSPTRYTGLSRPDVAVLALTDPSNTSVLWEDGLCLQAGMSLPQLASSTWVRFPRACSYRPSTCRRWTRAG